MSNIYHSPCVIEYWSEKRRKANIADLFRKGKQGDDPVMMYKQQYQLTQE